MKVSESRKNAQNVKICEKFCWMKIIKNWILKKFNTKIWKIVSEKV